MYADKRVFNIMKVYMERNNLITRIYTIHSKNRLVETTKKLVDMCLTKLVVKITNPSLVNYKFLTNHIG